MDETSPHIRISELEPAMGALQILAADYLPLYGQNADSGFVHYALCGFVESLLIRFERKLETAARAGRPLRRAGFHQVRRQLDALLTARDIAHALISAQLLEVEQFFALVQELYAAPTLSPQSVALALELGPADLRLLHAIVCCRLGIGRDEALFAGLRALEVLRDYRFHLDNFEAALAHGSYNPLILCRQRWGVQAEAWLVAQQKQQQQRVEAALAEGARAAGPDFTRHASRILRSIEPAAFAEELSVKLAKIE